MGNELSSVRVDKWLWAARFFKTRSLASEAAEGGRVQVNGLRAKPAKEIRIGDKIELSIGDQQWELQVAAVSDKRGPAPEARKLYQESANSIARREEAVEKRRLQHEPALEIHGRPTKRDRRLMDRWRQS